MNYKPLPFILYGSPISTPNGRIIYGFRHDMTQQRNAENNAEKERLAAAISFQAMIDQLPGVAYLACLNHTPATMYVSPKIEALLGFSADEWATNRDLRIRQLHPQDRERVLHTISAAKAANGAFNMEYRIFRRDGSLMWVHDEARIISNANNEALFLQGVALDITERKQAQQALQLSYQRLHQMIVELDMFKEQEHKRLAQEMHDDFGQLLTALKMDIATLRESLPRDDYRLAQQVVAIEGLVDTMVSSVRRIIADLPPQELEENGLIKALHSLAGNFAKRHQIVCTLTAPESELALDATIAAPLYRLVQESLNNVAKHAAATRVDILVSCVDGCLALSIADNGKGIAAADLGKPGSFGLIGMRERTALLGGELRVESTPGRGARLQFMIPLASNLSQMPVSSYVQAPGDGTDFIRM
jgi:two-component system sensor histidine kinase UhpB